MPDGLAGLGHDDGPHAGIVLVKRGLALRDHSVFGELCGELLPGGGFGFGAAFFGRAGDGAPASSWRTSVNTEKGRKKPLSS